jgi:hypothetical protein
MTEETLSPKADKLVKVYIKMRDAKAAKVRAHEEEIDALDANLDLITQELLEVCKATGQDGGKTAFGTFTRTVKTRYWTSDWKSMYDFIKENDAIELLEQRVAQGNMKQFLKDNPDKLPEGLNVDAKYSITVRRPTK